MRHLATWAIQAVPLGTGARSRSIRCSACRWLWQPEQTARRLASIRTAVRDRDDVIDLSADPSAELAALPVTVKDPCPNLPPHPRGPAAGVVGAVGTGAQGSALQAGL